MRSVLLAIGIVGAALLLLCVGVIFRKDHSFRSQHIHQNERMKHDGIKCALHEKEKNKKLKVNNL